MNNRSQTASSVFLVILTSVTVYLLYLVIKPLLGAILLAVVIAILVYPFYRRLQRRFKGRAWLASLIACFLVFCLLFLPVAIILGLLTFESLTLYEQANTFIQNGGVQKIMSSGAVSAGRAWIDKYLTLMGGSKADVRAKIVEQVQKLSAYFITIGQKVAANFVSAAALFFVMIFIMYFLFIEGETLVAYLVDKSPLPEARTMKLLRRFQDVTKAAFLGTFGVALAQGILGGIAFAIVGYQGIFWGILMCLFSLIPLVGAAVIWAPAGIILLVSGRWLAGIFLLAWGAGVVSTVDNFLRPYLMSDKSGLHPVVILLSVIGGVQYFGPLGIVLGPLTAALSLSLLDMFGEEFGSLSRRQNT